MSEYSLAHNAPLRYYHGYGMTNITNSCNSAWLICLWRMDCGPDRPGFVGHGGPNGRIAH